ncbi:MAG: MBL fold metallo-hydrolase [Myxococcales bacterium]|nr:MBL fold metallo-hydrolase [Myxococcales bacterium]
MQVHHLNCATLCPYGGRLLSGSGTLTGRARLVCHCLLVETSSGLVLVDSGLGLLDLRAPERSIGRGFVFAFNPALDPAETALHQVERLGFARADVRHIVLTHLDLDHAGGITDFPDATVHLHAAELQAARRPKTRLERLRYAQAQWAHDPNFAEYRETGEPWFGFDCVRDLRGLPPEILLIPLQGHTRGHAGVAVQTSGRWLLHAGDAYFHRDEMAPDRRRCPPLFDAFQRINEIDGRARMRNQERLRALCRESAAEVRVFSAHDPVEFERCLERAPKSADA